MTPYSLPWQVALVHEGTNYLACRGTLISDRHVLSAAHCPSNVDVVVGEHSLSGQSDGTRHTVCRAVNHRRYDSWTTAYDFKILHLREPVQFGPRAAPACLPTQNMGIGFLAGKLMTVSGWGTLSSGGGQPNVLHSVDVPGITNTQCSNAYSGYSITSSMLCAGDVANGGIDSCQGDSGGK